MGANGSATSRDTLRAKLLDSKVTDSKVVSITLFDQAVDVRQPSVKDVLAVREMEDPVARALHMIIRYVCVPGTKELVFEEGDVPILMEWPFGEDLSKLNKAIAELTGLDIEAVQAEKENLRSDPLAGTSSNLPGG
jgi:hypothetical protein